VVNFNFTTVAQSPYIIDLQQFRKSGATWT
jgi:hypothetical protein